MEEDIFARCNTTYEVIEDVVWSVSRMIVGEHEDRLEDVVGEGGFWRLK